VRAFLHGESITLWANEDLGNGWCAVCVEGYPIGLGKAVNGVIKNHLPKGLRTLSR
jgi:NOL1/NOP2/fmu family ribosome biogenesis protein